MGWCSNLWVPSEPWGVAQGHGPLWGIQPREARGGTITWCSLHSPPRMAPRSWGSTTPTLEVLGVTLLLEYSSHLYRFYRFFRFVVLEYSPVTKQVRRSMGVEVGATTIAFEHGDFSRAALGETKRTSRSEIGGVTSARRRQIGATGTKASIRQVSRKTESLRTGERRLASIRWERTCLTVRTRESDVSQEISKSVPLLGPC